MFTSNRIVEKELDDHLKQIEDKMDATVLSFLGPIVQGIEKEIRDAIENIKTKYKKKKLVVILETPGGYIEVTQRMTECYS